MLRRTLIRRLSKETSSQRRPTRTVVRDPRKSSSSKKALVASHGTDDNHNNDYNKNERPLQQSSSFLPPTPLPFQPNIQPQPNPQQQEQPSFGSTMASYMLAGAGVAIGFTIVGAVLGGF